MRLAVLWPQLSGYVDACLTELSRQGVDLLVLHRAAQPDAPFDDERFTAYRRWAWDDAPETDAVARWIADFEPDALLMSAWHQPAYRAVMRRFAGRAVRVLGMDNQWHGTPKQWLGRATSRVYLRPVFDCALVPGDRSAAFARRLGFADGDIIYGFNSADVPAFDDGPRPKESFDEPSFTFVGRLVPEKGVDVLAESYARYREAAGARAWPLRVAGVGPLSSAFDGLPGVERLGFVQPSDLPTVLRATTCLVLPSRFEPWGVVVHEAAAAGCSLICTSAVGAVETFLNPGWNGVVVTPGDAEELAEALTRTAETTPQELSAASEESRRLAQAITPQRWAANLVSELERRRARLPGPGTRP